VGVADTTDLDGIESIEVPDGYVGEVDPTTGAFVIVGPPGENAPRLDLVGDGGRISCSLEGHSGGALTVDQCA
jgi:hypothetical protein